jgi:hypothetical protein
LIASSCAQKGFPPGGPADTIPPKVLYAYPDSGATGVAPDSPISITFDDKMNRRTVESAFFVTPPTDMGSLTWDDKTVTVTSAEGLVENKTYTVLLGLGMQDRRGNRMRDPVLIYFSTGDSVAPGLVKGVVETGRAKAQNVMIWAYQAANCPPELGVTVPDGVGQAGTKGEFFVGGLDTRYSYCVYAHMDRDADGELGDDELFIGADSTVAFVSDSTIVSGITIYLVPDDEPGTLTGAVVDSAGPTQADIDAVVLPEPSAALPEPGDAGVDLADAVSMSAAPDSIGEVAGSVPDSTIAPGVSPSADSALVPAVIDSAVAQAAAAPVDTMALKRAIADSVYSAARIVIFAVDVADSANYAQIEIDEPGAFTIKGLSPGAYRLMAFRDLDRDKTYTPGAEPIALVEGLTVGPGRSTDAGALTLRRNSMEVRGK